MDNKSLTHLELLQAERLAFIETLTEQEKTEFLLRLLHDTSYPGFDQDSALSAVSPLNEAKSDNFVAIAASSSATSAPIRMTGAQAFQSNFRARCGCDQTGPCSSENHGQAYVDTDYNHGVGRGRYDIVVRIRHYGQEYYGASDDPWGLFVSPPAAYRLWTSSRLFGPGSPGRGGYFYSGNNQTPGRHTGAIGVEVFNPGTNDQVWWGIWYFSAGWGDWGDQWLRCGHTYNFWFADA